MPATSPQIVISLTNKDNEEQSHPELLLSEFYNNIGFGLQR